MRRCGLNLQLILSNNVIEDLSNRVNTYVNAPLLNDDPSSFDLLNMMFTDQNGICTHNKKSAHIATYGHKSTRHCVRTQVCYLAEHLLKKYFPQRRGPFALHKLPIHMVVYKYLVCLWSLNKSMHLSEKCTPAERNAISHWYFLCISFIADSLSSSENKNKKSCDSIFETKFVLKMFVVGR